VGIGRGSLKESLHLQNLGEEKVLHPILFPCKLHVLCITSPDDPKLQTVLPLYEKLISNSTGSGEIFIPEGQLHMRTVQEMFTKMSEKYFAPFLGTLKCGNLRCSMQLFPAPDVYKK
jgi:hypothetical protein